MTDDYTRQCWKLFTAIVNNFPATSKFLSRITKFSIATIKKLVVQKVCLQNRGTYLPNVNIFCPESGASFSTTPIEKPTNVQTG